MIRFRLGNNGSIISIVRKTSSGKVPRWLGLFFIIMGLIAVTISYNNYKDSKELQQHGVQTEAVVTDVRRSESHSRKGHRSVTYYPTVQYTDQAGNTHTVESNSGVSSRTRYQKGRSVQVLYMPNEPDCMEIVGLADPTSNFIAIAVGGVFVVVGGWIALFMRRNKEEAAPEADNTDI